MPHWSEVARRVTTRRAEALELTFRLLERIAAGARAGGARVVLATVTSGKAMAAVIGGLGINGKLLMVGAADPFEIAPLMFILKRLSVTGWPSGASIDSEDTLRFSALTGVRSMNEIYPLEKAPEAYDRMMSGKARFRVVLTTGN